MDTKISRIIKNAKLFSDQNWVSIALRGAMPLDSNWKQITVDNCLGILQPHLWASGSAQVNNLGILTGIPSNLTVLELPQKTGAIGTWNKILAQRPENETVDTFMVQMGDAGFQFYFSYNVRVPNIKNEKTGIRIRTTGDFIIAPYSVDPISGLQYLPFSGFTENSDGILEPTITPMPNWLKKYLKNL